MNPFIKIAETVGNPPDKESIRQLLQQVCDRIVNNTKFSFTDTSDNQEYMGSDSLPVDTRIRLTSGYNDWKYWNGVVHLAFLEMSETFKDPTYHDFVVANYRFGFTHLNYLRQLFEAGVDNANYHQFFRLDRLDDFGAMGAALIEVTDQFDELPVTEYIDKIREYTVRKQDRLDDGTFCRRRFEYTSVWGDDMYMSVPVLLGLQHFFGDDMFLQDAINQVIGISGKLFNFKKELYHHSWIKEADFLNGAFWGRANGWIMMAKVELLRKMPASHTAKKIVINLLVRQIKGLIKYQTASGMWRQLLDKQDSFEESSCTAMFVRGFAAAVNEGWIENIFASVAVAGWKGLINHVDSAGELHNVSTGFNIRQDITFYYNRPVEPGGDHGVGAFIAAGIEMYKLKEFRDCVWC